MAKTSRGTKRALGRELITATHSSRDVSQRQGTGRQKSISTFKLPTTTRNPSAGPPPRIRSSLKSSGYVNVFPGRDTSSCANESIPSPHHRPKTELEERSIWFPCLYLTLQRKLVDSPYFLRRHRHKRDEDGCVFTSRHIRVLFAFSAARQLLVLV
jgi:hypothetical protein